MRSQYADGHRLEKADAQIYVKDDYALRVRAGVGGIGARRDKMNVNRRVLQLASDSDSGFNLFWGQNGLRKASVKS